MRREHLALLLAALLAPAAWAANISIIEFQRPAFYADGVTPVPPDLAINYGVYQGERGQPKTRVATITATTSTIDVGLLSGRDYCWQVSAIANAVESDKSNEACKAFALVPGTVTITVR